MRKFFVIAGLIAFSLPAMAQDTPMRVTHDALAWKENPAFPKGVQVATLVGYPTKAGDVVVLRIKFPPNFQMPPHTHPYAEVVTIISGNIVTSHGEKFEKKGELLKPGSLWVYPAKHAHYGHSASSVCRSWRHRLRQPGGRSTQEAINLSPETKETCRHQFCEAGALSSSAARANISAR